ncbi:MAG: hypothetical protein HYS12_21570 [Planctomycetes bacterium]|nr:hypothetical protein [Planctomycetota bacterium]
MSRLAKLVGGVAFGLSAALFLAAPPAGAKEDKEDSTVKEGKAAPDVELPATSIDTVLPDKKEAKTLGLKELKGKNVVLYFFPKALTGG